MWSERLLIKHVMFSWISPATTVPPRPRARQYAAGQCIHVRCIGCAPHPPAPANHIEPGPGKPRFVAASQAILEALFDTAVAAAL